MKKIQKCPHCGQNTILYRRAIRKSMIDLMYRHFFILDNKPLNTTEISPLSRAIADYTKFQYWDLLEDTGNYKWIITGKGIDFLVGRLPVEKYKWIYNNEVQLPPPDAEGQDEFVYSFEVAPEVINKEIVLKYARPYENTPAGQQGLLF